MSGGNDDAGLGAAPKDCESCGAVLGEDQRYCLRCGARNGPIPAEFAEWLAMPRSSAAAAPLDDAGAAGLPVDEGGLASTDDAPADDDFEDASFAERYMPEPRSAAIATMALLAFGVVIGAATGPLAQSAAVTPIIVEMGPPPATEAGPEGVEAPPEAIAEGPAPAPEVAGPELPEGAFEQEPPPTTEPPPEEFTSGELPPIEHVFLIVLGEHGFEEGFGESSPAPYLAQELVSKGELVGNYYAVTQGRLANELALVSGQGPTVATAAGCPERADIGSPAVGTEEQVEGEGCVYPEATRTLPGQLAEAKKTWKSYVEGGVGCEDETTPDPPLFFHALLDAPDCAEHNVDLTQLTTDLASAATTPSFSYIVPNACHDGSEQPCKDGGRGGLAEAQPFLEEVVPGIQGSAAYKAGGLIAITFAQAPQSGPGADQSACCGTPEYPNLPPPAQPPAPSGPVKPSGGGGRVGLLLLSPYVTAGSVNESGYYNHFSLLLSIEELFALPPIGYAASPTLIPFDSSIYNLTS